MDFYPARENFGRAQVQWEGGEVEITFLRFGIMALEAMFADEVLELTRDTGLGRPGCHKQQETHGELVCLTVQHIERPTRSILLAEAATSLTINSEFEIWMAAP
jgi:hypothetical protein